MKKKQMMMALVSLMVLAAQAQANFQVSVSILPRWQEPMLRWL